MSIFKRCEKKKKKGQQVPRKLVLGGVMFVVTCTGPACIREHRTNKIFYVTSGSGTHYLSDMPNYVQTKVRKCSESVRFIQKRKKERKREKLLGHIKTVYRFLSEITASAALCLILCCVFTP